MLVRKQILLEERQVIELERLCAIHEFSLSRALRLSTDIFIKDINTHPTIQKKITGAGFFLKQARKAVPGPGDSEYDRYAYD